MKSLPVIICFCAAASPAVAQVVNQKTKQEKRVIRSVLVLPPTVSLARLGMKGSEGMGVESEQVADLLYQAICRELTSRGAKTLPQVLNATSKDEERYALADVQRKYSTVAVQMYKHPGRVKSGRYTLGDSVAAWPPAATADTLVFVQAGGSVMTADRQAFGWAILGPRFSQLAVRMGFVDARSGDVLAFGTTSPLGNATKKSVDALQVDVRMALADLPLPSRPVKSGRQ